METINHSAPEVSVVVPVYNTEKYLDDCLKSILRQTFQNIEILCIDDGSTDGSAALLKKYASLDPRLQIITQKNAGLSCARNAGMAAARGKYIYFVDSDDFIAPETLEMLVKRMHETAADIVICNMLLYFDDTKTYAGFRDEVLYYQLKNRTFTLEEVPQIINCVAAWDRLFDRKFLAENHFAFLPKTLYEDALFTVQTVLKAKRIAVIPDHLYFYRKNTGISITDNEARSQLNRQNFLTIQKAAYETLQAATVSASVWRYHLELTLTQVRMHLGNCPTQEEFNSFFKQAQSLLSLQGYEALQASNRQDVLEFAAILLQGDPARAMELLGKHFQAKRRS